jgi:hypothetical protein
MDSMPSYNESHESFDTPIFQAPLLTPIASQQPKVHLLPVDRDLIRYFRSHIRNHLQEVFHHLVSRLLASLLDLLNLDLCIGIGIFLGLFVSLLVLFIQSAGCIGVDRALPALRTSASNFLNSSSFCFLYSSISLCASDLASFTRFVRSGLDQLGANLRGSQ